MESVRALPSEIEQALARGWVVLTANQRAARTLRHAFDLRQRDRGRPTWEPPQILAWDTWTAGLWNTLLLDGHTSLLRLSPAQEHTLWRAIIAADETSSSLRPVDDLATTAARAWKLLHDYHCRPQLQSYAGNTDTRTFTRWAAEFERRCSRSQYLSEAQLPEALRPAIARNHLDLRSGYLLVGFDSKTTAQAQLLDAVRSAGSSIQELAAAASAPSLTLADSPDEHSELTACAHWLRARLTEQPGARIAVIVPSIDTGRAEIDRVFRHILAPELNSILAAATSGPYEFSLGIPLARTPMAAAALDILRWAGAPLPLDRVCNLLLSPHFAAAPQAGPEPLARAEFDAFVLRRLHLLEPQLSLDRLLYLASNSSYSAGMPALLRHLRALRPAIARYELSGDRDHADWAAAIHNLLDAAGWAPLAYLDSTEFQIRKKWDEALDELATLDFDGTRISFTAAVASLERIASEALFAPESRHAPVQIMGPLESAGSTFDAVWFLHAGDMAWPAGPSPNPLLPWSLQRDFAMPGVDPALDTAHVRRITERIAASAPTVLFSYAKQSAGSRQRPSPILAALPLELRSAAEIAPAPAAAAPVLLDSFDFEAPIPPPPEGVLQGGAGILQAQAACGFRAFAEKRLFASAPDTTTLGLDAQERGSIVHTALERFWAAVETQSALQQMPSGARDALLTRAIDDALAGHYAQPEAGWPAAYIRTERQRLLNLLGPWLDYEATQRPPFTVLAREESLPGVSIGPLRLDVRVDRVDINLKDGEPGGEIILDYKTGSAKPADWLGPRPDAPQLPLYAVVSNPANLAAVAFALVRPGNQKEITGYEAGRSGILPRPAKLQAPSFEAQVDEWRVNLAALAGEFHAGSASVSPKHYPQTCQYCEQRLLCRLNPSSLAPEAIEDLESGDTLEENDCA